MDTGHTWLDWRRSLAAVPAVTRAARTPLDLLDSREGVYSAGLALACVIPFVRWAFVGLVSDVRGGERVGRGDAGARAGGAAAGAATPARRRRAIRAARAPEGSRLALCQCQRAPRPPLRTQPLGRRHLPGLASAKGRHTPAQGAKLHKWNGVGESGEGAVVVGAPTPTAHLSPFSSPFLESFWKFAVYATFTLLAACAAYYEG